MDVLDAYADLSIPSHPMPFDHCLREFMAGFRLPGEVRFDVM